VGVRGRRGAGDRPRRPAHPHPALDLFESPSTKVDYQTFMRQTVADLRLTGNYFWLVLGVRAKPDGIGVTGTPTSLLRLHPARVEIVPDASGQPRSYIYDATGRRTEYPWAVVIHGRSISWSDDPTSLWGTGAIQAMHRDIKADIAASERTAEAMQQGRPAAIVSPGEAGATIAPTQAAQLSDNIAKTFKARNGGVAVFGVPLKFEALSWSPNALDIPGTHERARETLMAALGLVPTRHGLPTANYATSREQNLTYWQSALGFAEPINMGLTRVARMFPRSEGVRAYLDASKVEALQTSRTERQQRVINWVTWLGLDPADAAAYEGFDDLPVPAMVEEAEPSAPVIPDQQDDETRAITTRAAIEVLFGVEDAIEVVRAVEPEPPAVRALSYATPATEEDRTAVWRGFADHILRPTEQTMSPILLRALRLWAHRVAERAERLLPEAASRSASPNAVTRDLTDDLLEQIIADEEERAELRKALGDRIALAIEQAFRLTARSMGADLDFDPDRSPAEALMGELISHVSQTTKDEVRKALIDALDEGKSAVEIAQDLRNLHAFSPNRALTIARTETTRAVNAGSATAIERAGDEAGVRVRKEWLSSRDSEVRDAHRDLDGVVVDADGKFRIGSDTADAPGGFSQPGNSINCRCTIIPRIED
jgi:SPP1 gp7 family putative phage head morphogenesis protein